MARILVIAVFAHIAPRSQRGAILFEGAALGEMALWSYSKGSFDSTTRCCGAAEK